MTSPPYEASAPKTGEEFHDQLRRLIRTAERSGVDVAGGWACRGDDTNQSDWDVEIIEVLSE